MKLLGILTAGLRDDARVVQRKYGMRKNDRDVILASILDGVNWMVWSRTKDGEKGRNRPEQLAPKMFIEEKDEVVYESPEAFDRERERILEMINDG